MSFEHNKLEISFLTNKNQDIFSAGMYKMSNVLKISELVCVDCPTRAASWVGPW